MENLLVTLLTAFTNNIYKTSISIQPVQYDSE